LEETRCLHKIKSRRLEVTKHSTFYYEKYLKTICAGNLGSQIFLI
jgi:hypothetical protein